MRLKNWNTMPIVERRSRARSSAESSLTGAPSTAT
jgi:hypothetical protein